MWIPTATFLSLLLTASGLVRQITPAGQSAPAPVAATTPTQVQSTAEIRPGVQKIPLDQPTAARLQARKTSYKVTVTGADWVDTQLVVAPGDSVESAATGDISLG